MGLTRLCTGIFKRQQRASPGRKDLDGPLAGRKGGIRRMMLGAWVPGFGLFLWTQSGHPSDLGRKLGGGLLMQKVKPPFIPHLSIWLYCSSWSWARAFPAPAVGGGCQRRPSQPCLPLLLSFCSPGTGFPRDCVHIFFPHCHSPYFLELSSENKGRFFQDCLPT